MLELENIPSCEEE